jgi:hypothetical protein
MNRRGKWVKDEGRKKKDRGIGRDQQLQQHEARAKISEK